MNQGTYPLAASMINQINRVDNISNNLANSRTIGFKEDGLVEGSFNHYLKKAENNEEKISYINEITNKVPKIDGKYISKAQGAIVGTGNNLDFALKTPETYFAVLTQNGDVQYTRDGSFKNLDGFIVDGNGNNILSADGEALAVEDGFQEAIGVFQITNSNLKKVGDNNYELKNQNLIDQQVVAVENNETFVLQGSLEKSNINAVVAMVDLIEANRRIEQSQKAMTGIDDLNAKVIQKLGENG